MKLLFCLKCSDLFNLDYEVKACSCKKTKGQYTDELNAWYEGPCIPVGISNPSLSEAMRNQTITENGPKVDTWIVPQKSKTMVRRKGKHPKFKNSTAQEYKLLKEIINGLSNNPHDKKR